MPRRVASPGADDGGAGDAANGAAARPRGRPRPAPALGLGRRHAAAAAVLMFCYLRIAGTTQVNSDGAGLELEAWNILHGNVLLHGWWATDVSFYTTELPEYMVVTAFAGLRPEVVHICSALTYTLLVLLAAFVARGRARGAEGVVRALLAAAVMLAPQPAGPTQVLLGSPDHVGTGVPVLVLLLLLDWAPARDGRPRWYVPVARGRCCWPGRSSATRSSRWSASRRSSSPACPGGPAAAGGLRRSALPGRFARLGPRPGPPPGTSCRWRPRRSPRSLSPPRQAGCCVALGGFRTAKAWYGLLRRTRSRTAAGWPARACSPCSAPTSTPSTAPGTSPSRCCTSAAGPRAGGRASWPHGGCCGPARRR